MKVKKIISGLRIIMVFGIFIMMAIVASAENIKSGICGMNAETMEPDASVTWEYDENTATLSFEGNGYMKDYYSSSSTPWYGYRNDIKSIIVFDGVKSVGINAFTEIYNLQNIEIADSVEYFGVNSEDGGGSVFSSLYYQNEENWIDGMMYAGNHLVATDSERLIGDCKIREGTKSITGGTFQSCHELNSLEIPDSVEFIGIYAINDCKNLKTINLPANIKTIGFQTLGNCPSLESLSLPIGMEKAKYAFDTLENLKTVEISESVAELTGCFYGCNQITDVYYSGTKEQWNRIITDADNITMEENNIFPEAVVHFKEGDDIKVFFNGNQIEFDQLPVIQSGRTLVPVRAIFEALGATVEWNDGTKTVTSIRGDIEISMVIGSNQIYKNDKAITLDVAPQIINSRTLVPVRAIAESFNCMVDWNEENNTVIINS